MPQTGAQHHFRPQAERRLRFSSSCKIWAPFSAACGGRVKVNTAWPRHAPAPRRGRQTTRPGGPDVRRQNSPAPQRFGAQAGPYLHFPLHGARPF